MTDQTRNGLITEMLEALKDARQTIIDLKNSRWSECEGSDDDWTGDIDAIIAKAGEALAAQGGSHDG